MGAAPFPHVSSGARPAHPDARDGPVNDPKPVGLGRVHAAGGRYRAAALWADTFRTPSCGPASVAP